MLAPVSLDNHYVEAQISTGTWTDISSYIVGDLDWEMGFLTNEHDDKSSAVGYLEFSVNNSQGHFNPTSANFLGVKKNTQIRVRCVYGAIDEVKYIGKITEFPQTDIAWGDAQILDLVAATWEDETTKRTAKGLTIEEDKRIDEGLTDLLASSPSQPPSANFSSGTYTFDRIFDALKDGTKIAGEISKFAVSEFSEIYPLSDGTFTAENRETRVGTRPLAVFSGITGSFANDMLDKMDIDYGKNVVNHIEMKSYAKSLDTSQYINLVDITDPIYLPQGILVEKDFYFTDPNDRSKKINGYSVQHPSGTADYSAFANENGTGAEYTSSIYADAQIYANYEHAYFIANDANCWLTEYRVRGYGLNAYVPVTKIAENDTSIEENGPQELNFDQKYQNNSDAGYAEAVAIVAIEKDPRLRGNEVPYLANIDDKHMKAFLQLDIGDLVHIQNDDAGYDHYAYIHGVKAHVTPAGIVYYWWKLKDMFCFRKGLTPLEIRYPGLLNSFAGIEFPPSPLVQDVAPFTLMWRDFRRDNAGYGMGHHPMSKAFLGTYLGNQYPTSGWFVFVDSDGYITLETANGDGSYGAHGKWRTATAILSGTADQWKLCSVAYNPLATGTTPRFEVGGVLQSTTTVIAPLGTYISDASVPFVIGTVHAVDNDWPNDFNGYMKDMRLYNKLVTGTTGYMSHEDDYEYETDGLVWHGFGFRSDLDGNYVGQPLTIDTPIIEQIHGFAGRCYVSGTASASFLGATPFSSGTYDDTHDLFDYRPGFTNEAGDISAYGGSLHYATSPGSYFTFDFYGSKLYLIYTQRPERGTLVVYVDNALDGYVYQSGTIAHQQQWASGDYALGPHTVKVAYSAGGSNVDFDGLIVN